MRCRRFLALLPLLLSGCGQAPADSNAAVAASSEATSVAAVTEEAGPTWVPTSPVPLYRSPSLAPMLSPVAPPTPVAAVSNDPQAVLQGWGAAIEARDWRAVRALWGDRGGRSGLTPQAFAARWDSLRRPRVAIGSGEQEGAAGSLYYTAPITIRDEQRALHGSVTLRRANDVPGATAEQLRWHIDRAKLPGLSGDGAEAP